VTRSSVSIEIATPRGSLPEPVGSVDARYSPDLGSAYVDSLGERRVVTVRLYVRHGVGDYAAWRAVYDDFDTQRRSMGVTGDEVFQSVDDPNDVTVWHDFDSEDSARAFASSDELREASTEAGVQGQPQVWFTSRA
jgi:heme-degrading monooxygenase HmoA